MRQSDHTPGSFEKPALQALYELVAAQVNLLLEIRPEARQPLAFRIAL
jgi:hypothetical protein